LLQGEGKQRYYQVKYDTYEGQEEEEVEDLSLIEMRRWLVTEPAAAAAAAAPPAAPPAAAPAPAQNEELSLLMNLQTS